MNILLSNDDGIHAKGLATLARAVEGIASHLDVIAPDRNRSGASNSLTLDAPLRVLEIKPQWFAVGGTPTDCVHLAISGLLATRPELILSGINDGANLGDDVLYSGTVAAAMEGRSLGVPALAFSLVNADAHERHFETAELVVRQLVMAMQNNPLPKAVLYNINIPNLPYSAIKGFKLTRLGHRHPAEAISQTRDPRGRLMYWVGAPGDGRDAVEGTDFKAITDGFVSLTPLMIDLTDYARLPEVGDWLGLLANG